MTKRLEVKVLLVEDNPTDVLTMKEYLSDLPGVEFKVHQAERLAEAMDFLREESCDVILLDLGLPDSQGVDTFARLHSLAADVPILVLTGLNDESVGLDTVQRGAQDYLVKRQVQPPLLGKAIRYAIERQRSTAELKLQAKRLQASEARVQAVIDSTTDAVFVVDFPGTIRFVNPAGENMFSRQATDLTTNRFPFPLVAERVTEVEIIGPDGGNRAAEMRVTETEWDGERVRLVWLHDITEHKRIEETLLRSEKLQALGTLAGGIAHDFNNILLAVSGNAKLALTDLPEDHPAYASVLEIAKAGSRATALTKKILSFSRQEPVKQRVMQVQPVVEEALSMLRATLPARIEIRKDFAADVPPISADSSQVHQIIVNLATNAADAVGDRPGVLEISARRVHLNGERASLSSTLPAGDYVRLSVKDDGDGMDKKTVGRVFEPFFTTKPQGRGTGMGLAIVYGIMKDHLGEVTVYSEVGKGTVFNLYFPVAEVAPSAIQPPVSPPPLGQSNRILYVDDEEPLVCLMTRTLKRLGYQVIGFSDPFEALKTLRQNPTDFDAVVTDLSMPTMSGIDLAQEVSQLRADLPVVITTGYIRPQDQDAAQRVGVCELILKPDGVEELGNALHRVLGGAKAKSQSA